MATNMANVGTLLRAYSVRMQTAIINYYDFCDYVKKYSERHVEEQADLIRYLGHPEPSVRTELDELIKNNQAAIVDRGPNKKFIIALTYFSVSFSAVYKNIVANPVIPFPKLSDLPKQVPSNLISKESVSDFLPRMFEKQDLKSLSLFCIVLPHEVPSILFPEAVPIEMVTDAAMAKIRLFLKKDEYHDYFLKKLKSTNHGKEIAVQNFYNDFLNNQRVATDYVTRSIEYFYLLSQLCYFIRTDVAKVKDMTAEDENILQSVSVAEIQLSYLKTKMQKEQIRDAALKELESNFKQIPYFFTMESIYRFTDSHGNTLYGQYSEDDLRNYLTTKTKAGTDGALPELLVFETESKTKYFINKDNVFPLVLRLCGEAHERIYNDMVELWTAILYNYDKLPEMKSNEKFNEKLHEELRQKSPVLYALLNSAFLPVLHYETVKDADEADFRLFSNSELLPYSEILIINADNIMSAAKMNLPFWYSIPFIPVLMSMFRKKKADKKVPPKKEAEQQSGRKSREQEIASAAKILQSDWIPEGSNIDRELSSYEAQWNKLITPKAHDQLTADVNAFIRDYLRKAARTFSGQSITASRIEGLADTLMNAPNMKKIGHTESLKMYVKLYMLRLLGNFN